MVYHCRSNLQKLKHSTSNYGSNSRNIMLQSRCVTPGSAVLLSSSHEMLIGDSTFPWSNRFVRASSFSSMVNAPCNQHSGPIILSSSHAKPPWQCTKKRGRISVRGFLKRLGAGILCWAAQRLLRRVKVPRPIRIRMPSKKVIFFLVLGSCAVVTFCIAGVERIPYSRRIHVALSNELEDVLAQFFWELIKEENKGVIRNPRNRKTKYVASIAVNILRALYSGLKLQNDFSVNGNTYSVKGPKRFTLAEKWGLSSLFTPFWGASKDVMAANHHQESQNQLMGRPATKHLDGYEWEICVANSKKVNAFSAPGGKIVVYTGMLNKVESDEELATVLAHEIAHCVARHSVESSTIRLWLASLTLAVLSTVPISWPVLQTSIVALKNFISRGLEAEADYIGLMLMASAGYDPRVAPKFYAERIGSLRNEESIHWSVDWLIGLYEFLFASHPSPKKRAKLLEREQVMNEAIAIYKEVKAGKGVEFSTWKKILITIKEWLLVLDINSLT